MDKLFVNFLPPWVETNIQPAFYDKESGSVLQQTARMYAKVQCLVRMFNKLSKETNETVNEYIAKFVELKDFVDTYFDNLDVQEEINNKLDEMAEDGTLEEIIGHYILGKVEYIFQKFIPNFASGDCCLIKTTNKNILVDTDNNNTNSDGLSKWLYVQQMLLDNDVDHIDVLIISHYHGDHIGNINNLIQNDYIDSETVAYLGCIPDTYGQPYINGGNSVRSALESAGVTCTYPSEGQSVTLDTDFTAKFVNATKAVVDAYTVKNENNCSMCVFFKHGNITSFYSADGNRAIFNYLYSQGYPLSSVELFKVHHHGLEPLVTKPFITELAPTYSVVTQYINDYALVGGTSSSELYSLLNAVGSKVYCSFQQTDYIKFVSSPDAMTNTSGKANIIDESQVVYDLYVDSSVLTNHIQDGSQDHPFSQINQAIGVVPNLKDAVVNVHISAGDYNYFETGDNLKDRLFINSGKNTVVNLFGDENDNTAVKINAIYAKNSYVNLKDLTLDCDNYRGIVASDSVVNFDNVLITSLTKESSYNDGLLFTNNSQGSNTGELTFDKVSHCIRLQTNSKFNACNTINIGAHSDTIVDKTESSILYNRNYFAFTTASDKLAVPYYSVVRQPESIMKAHADFATTIELTKSVTGFDWIEVFYQDAATSIYSTGRIYSCNNKTIPIHSMKTDSVGKLEYNGILLRFINDTGTVYRPAIYTIASNGTVATPTTTNPINIVKVIGGYKDYVDLN